MECERTAPGIVSTGASSNQLGWGTRDSIEASGTDERMIEIVQSVSHHSATLEVSDTAAGFRLTLSSGF